MTIISENSCLAIRDFSFESELEEFRVYTKDDVEQFCNVFFNPKEPQEKLQPILDKVVEVWKTKKEDDREDFRGILQSFIRLYGFISQLITYEDVELEQLYVFGRSLNRKLPRRKNQLPTEVMDAIDLDSFRVEQTFTGDISLRKEDGKTKGITTGAPTHTDEQKDWLSQIINNINETYGANLTEDDRIDVERMQELLVANEELQAAALADNSKEGVKHKFDKVVDMLLLDYVTSKTELFKKLTEPKVNLLFKKKWFGEYYRQYAQD